tara:strand:+ start:93 stop:542 length:450 start_codon:yes stop_codon:yes gene_type:complete
MSIFFIVGCGDSELEIQEIEISSTEINFPFEERKNGKFISIFRNNGNEIVPISLFLIIRDTNDSLKNKNYCDEVNLIRQGRFISDWTIINGNLPIIPEKEIINQNDHPGLVSYNLPLGTYILMLNNEVACSEKNYKVFEITTNDAFEVN